jgi:hypothetical protein
VPVWHEQTSDFRKNGDLVQLGIVQEQHPDRVGLFMQWKEMDWPILIDPLNLLGVRVVPIHVLIDEAGVVRSIPRAGDPEQMRQVVKSFVENEAARSEPPTTRSAIPDLDQLDRLAASESPMAMVRHADALVLWRGAEGLDQAIERYSAARESLAETDASLTFRLGVAHRARFDSSHRRPGDFSAAVRYWREALEADPNQYIWRRRIQQYGPQLDKPYPFYDWVVEAREQIESRGERPVKLIVEPGGAELAERADRFAGDATDAAEPDPGGRIDRDLRGYITAEVVQVDHTDPRGRTARMHIVLTPDISIDAHWNNEAEPLTLWMDPPEGWAVSTRRVVYPNPTDSAATTETRAVEFEVKPPPNVTAGDYELSGYALYNVCESAEGVCLYRRQDIRVTVKIGASP